MYAIMSQGGLFLSNTLLGLVADLWRRREDAVQYLCVACVSRPELCLKGLRVVKIKIEEVVK